MMTLPPDFRRALALLLLLTVFVAVYGAVVEPVLALHRRFDTQWMEGEARLAHYRRFAGMLAELQRIDAELHAAAEGPVAYVESPSATLAAAQLEESLSAITRQHGVQLIGTRMLDAVDGDEFQQVGLHVTMSATLGPLQAAIQALEAHLPIFFIDGLSIQRRDAGFSVASVEADPQLDVAFDLLAYRRQR